MRPEETPSVPFSLWALLQANNVLLLSTELSDWLGGVQEEQMADGLHRGHRCLHH